MFSCLKLMYSANNSEENLNNMSRFNGIIIEAFYCQIWVILSINKM